MGTTAVFPEGLDQIVALRKTLSTPGGGRSGDRPTTVWRVHSHPINAFSRATKE